MFKRQLNHTGYFDFRTTNRRQPLYSRLSPQPSPFRRESESGPFSRMSDFELPWPPVPQEGRRRMKYSDNNHVVQPMENSNVPDLASPRDSCHEDNNPNSQMVTPKVDREKHMHNFETPRSTAYTDLEDSRSRNQELLDSSDDRGAPAWVINALEVGSASGHTTSPPMSPFYSTGIRPRPVMDNNENAEQVEQTEPHEPSVRTALTASNISSSSTVPMNIRCEESAIELEDSSVQNENVSRSNESTSNNNNNNI